MYVYLAFVVPRGETIGLIVADDSELLLWLALILYASKSFLSAVDPLPIRCLKWHWFDKIARWIRICKYSFSAKSFCTLHRLIL